MDLVSFPDRRPPLDENMGADLRIPADGHVLADDRVGAHLDALCQSRVRVHDCRGMYLHFVLECVLHISLSTIMAISSASATTAPSTCAFALRLRMVDRILITSSSKRTWSPGTTGLRNFALSM